MYDLLVFIGRFQPLHLGHQEVIERALSLSKRVLVLVGSSGQARSTRNPFTFEERRGFIDKAFPTATNLIVRPLRDHTYNDTAWITEVQQHVKEVLLGGSKNCWVPDGLRDFKVGLIGCNKDHTSYYLKMFPDYASESVEFINPLNATAIRNQMYDGTLPHRWEEAAVMNPKVYDRLVKFMETPEFAKLRSTHEFLVKYREKYGPGPHETADALIQVGGKILLIRRGKEYGHGLLAMPGGFKHLTERFREAMVRELKEETKIKVPRPVLLGSIVNSHLADDPGRSERGVITSMVYHIKLENDVSLPEVRGSDDADEAFWMDIADLREEDFFEDHYHIIKLLLGIN